MRPRQLEIQGLQSFKDIQKIDFDLLGETGLFGIFGPTGSGKSTILDAITLALYGSVQRANRGTQGIINTDSDSVKVSFSFDLLKGSERKSYRIERLFKRKKGVENSAETKLVRLFEISPAGESIFSDKLGEVNARVVELLGLQEDDFTRSVVLPQNKFQEFLLMEKAKKREMLERIFYLEEYGRRLMEKVARKLAAVRTGLAGLEGAMSTLGDVSGEVLSQAEAELKAAEGRRLELDRELKKAECAYTKAKEVWELYQEIQFVTAREQEHSEKLEEMKRKKEMLKNSLKADAVTDFIRAYRETEHKLLETKALLEQNRAEFLLAEARLREGIKRQEEKIQENEEAKPRLIEQKTRLNHAVDMRKEADSLDKSMELLRLDFKNLREKSLEKEREIADKGKSLEAAEQKLSLLQKEIEQLKVDIDFRNSMQEGVRLEDALVGAFKDFEERKTRLSELRKKTGLFHEQLDILQKKVAMDRELLEQLGLDMERHQQARPDNMEELLREMRELQAINALWEVLMAAHQDFISCKQKYTDIMEAEERLTKDGFSAAAEMKSKALQLERLLEDREKLKTTLQRNSAAQLAKTLQEGEACPVCGSTHHPFPAEGIAEDLRILEEKLDNMEKMVLQADREARASEGECIKLEEQLKALRLQQVQCLEELNLKTERKEELSERLPAEIRALEPEEISCWLELKMQDIKTRQAGLEQWETVLKEKQDNTAKQNEAYVLACSEEKTKRAELELLRSSLEEEEKNFEQVMGVYEGKKRLIEIFLKKYGVESPSGECKKIEEADRKAEMLVKERDSLQDLQKNIQKELEQLVKERQVLGEKLKEIEVDGRNLKQRKEEKDGKLAEFAHIPDLEQEIRRMDEKLLQLSQQEKETAEETKRLKEAFDQAAIQKSSLENQQDIYSKNLEKEERKLQNVLEEKGFENIEVAEAAVMNAQEQQALEKEISEYDRIQNNIKAQRELLENRLQGRSITEDEWRRSIENYENKSSEKEEGISLVEGLKNRYATLKGNFDKWSELEREYQQLRRKNDMLEQIQKLLKGNTFIDYISEERLRYVAREASEILGVLTKFRYAIELDAENGFVVRDNTGGGVCRPVSSLSGGETFLTSLSLALALSKQIQLKGQSPLEFFFLDEGFGTLDGSLLDTVMDSLERLGSKDRVIGLISHVPELKNRISRRLVVEPPSMDGKGSRVRIEKL